MGAFLDKPKTDKHTENGMGQGLRYGLGRMQGWRAEMEDAYCALIGLPQDKLKDWSFFALFDGHAGAKVSEYCSKRLLEVITEGAEFSSEELSSDSIQVGMRSGFLRLDNEIRQNIGEDKSGSTAISILISPKHIFVANCGDSRMVLSRATMCHFSTKDHKPIDPQERERIQNAGGSVMMERVNGSLAVSRALGDFNYKNVQGKEQCEQLVSPEPDIFAIERSPEDEFAILACDGIWDVMSNKELCDLVRHHMTVSDDLELICNAVMDMCFQMGCCENMIIIIISFRKLAQKRETCVSAIELITAPIKLDLDLIPANKNILSKKCIRHGSVSWKKSNSLQRELQGKLINSFISVLYDNDPSNNTLCHEKLMEIINMHEKSPYKLLSEKIIEEGLGNVLHQLDEICRRGGPNIRFNGLLAFMNEDSIFIAGRGHSKLLLSSKDKVIISKENDITIMTRDHLDEFYVITSDGIEGKDIRNNIRKFITLIDDPITICNHVVDTCLTEASRSNHDLFNFTLLIAVFKDPPKFDIQQPPPADHFALKMNPKWLKILKNYKKYSSNILNETSRKLWEHITTAMWSSMDNFSVQRESNKEEKLDKNKMLTFGNEILGDQNITDSSFEEWQMIKDKRAGFMLVKIEAGTTKVLTVQEKNGKIGFPKGAVKTSESIPAGARREVFEETKILIRPCQILDEFRLAGHVWLAIASVPPDTVVNPCKKELKSFQ